MRSCRRIALAGLIVFTYVLSLPLSAQEEEAPDRNEILQRITRRIRADRPALERFSANVRVRLYGEDGRRESHGPRFGGFVASSREKGFRTLIRMAMPSGHEFQRSVLDHVADSSGRAFRLNWFGEEAMLSGAYRQPYGRSAPADKPHFITGLLTEGNEISYLPLLEYHIYPASLKGFQTSTVQPDVEWEGTSYTTLTRTSRWIGLGRDMHIQYRLFWNPSNARMERAVLRMPFMRMEMTVHEWERTSGMSIPTRLRLSFFEGRSKDEDRVVQMRIHLTDIRVNEKLAYPVSPDWRSDPALTAFRDTSLKEARKELKKAPDQPDRYTDYVSAVISDLVELIKKLIKKRKFERIEKRLRTNLKKLSAWFENAPVQRSDLLQDQRTAISMLSRRYDQATAFANDVLEEDRGLSPTLFGGARVHMRRKDYEAARKLLKPLRDDPAFGPFADRYLFRISIRGADAPEKLQQELASYLSPDLDPERAFDRLGNVQGFSEYTGPTLLSDRSVSFLNELRERASNRYVRFAIARALMFKLDHEDEVDRKTVSDALNEIYGAGSVPKPLRADVERFVRTSPSRTDLKVFENIEDQTEDLAVLVHYAGRLIDADRPDDTMRVSKRLVSRMNEQKKDPDAGHQHAHRMRRLPMHGEGFNALVRLMAFLHGRDQSELTISLMEHVARIGGAGELMEEMGSDLRTFVNNRSELAYRLARHIPAHETDDLDAVVKPERLLNLALKRIESDRGEPEDYRFLRRLMRPEHVSLQNLGTKRFDRTIRALEKGATQAEKPREVVRFRERIGDVQLASGDTAAAAETYLSIVQNILQEAPDNGKSRQQILSMFTGGNTRDVDHIDLMSEHGSEKEQTKLEDRGVQRWPLLIKLVQLHDTEHRGAVLSVLDRLHKILGDTLHEEKTGNGELPSGANSVLSQLLKAELMLKRDEQVRSLLQSALAFFHRFASSSGRGRRVLYRFGFLRQTLQMLKKHKRHAILFVCAKYLERHVDRGGDSLEKYARKSRSNMDRSRIVKAYLNRGDFPEANDPEAIQKRIRELGSKRYQIREKAMKKLTSMGEEVVPYLKAKRTAENVEVRKRVKQLLDEMALDAFRQSIVP